MNDNKSMIDGKPATRRHFLIHDEDYDFIAKFYGDSIGISAAVRMMIKAQRARVERKVAEAAKSVKIDNSTIESILDED